MLFFPSFPFSSGFFVSKVILFSNCWRYPLCMFSMLPMVNSFEYCCRINSYPAKVKAYFMFSLCFALTSKYLTLYYAALLSASVSFTVRYSLKSDLLPSKITIGFYFLLCAHNSNHSPKFSKLRSPNLSTYYTCDIENDEGYSCILKVARNQGSKSFLPGRIPKLQPKNMIVNWEVFGHEIYANSCLLNKGKGTPNPSSNLSCIKRMRMEVLPVDWSPRKTTLIFVLMF